MTLSDLCTHTTTTESTLLPPDHKLGSRLVCPEYSKSVQEVKSYPLPPKERIFALCWNIDGGHTLRATLCPSPEPFRYQLHFSSNEKTQLHTHDYIELAYVVEGEFRQIVLHLEHIQSI